MLFVELPLEKNSVFAKYSYGCKLNFSSLKSQKIKFSLSDVGRCSHKQSEKTEKEIEKMMS